MIDILNTLTLFASASEHGGLVGWITGLGVPAIMFTVFAESGLLVGFFLPGDSLLFASGAFIRQGVIDINVHLFVLLLFISAVLGDSVGYAFGKSQGRKLFKREDSKLFHKANLIKAEDFYKKHGSKTIVLARFVPFVRTFAPIVAGIAHMNYRTFLTYNIVGAGLWTTIFVYLGYAAGELIEQLGINLELAVLLVVGLSILPLAIHFIRDKYFKKQPSKKLDTKDIDKSSDSSEE